VLNNESAPELGPVLRDLANAAKRVPPSRNEKPTHPSTLARWISKGIRLPDGTVLKLEGRRYPGAWMVSDEAVDEFVNALTRARTGEPAEVAPVAPAACRKAVERAERELERLGI
jgi:hypothetical protein